MDMGDAPLEDSSSTTSTQPHPLALPALSAWLSSLAINSLLFSSKDASAAFALSGKALASIGKAASQTNSTFTPPILSPLIARLYRYRSLSADKSDVAATSQVRSELVHAHRLACLSRATDVQATLLNLMLRDLLGRNEIDQAKKLSQVSNPRKSERINARLGMWDVIRVTVRRRTRMRKVEKKFSRNEEQNNEEIRERVVYERRD